MSEKTTNGSGEMKVINGDDKAVKEKVEKFGVEVTAVTVQFFDRKVRNDEIAESGDTINKPGDFVLASNPKAKTLSPEEISGGNKGKVKEQDEKSKAQKAKAKKKQLEEKEAKEKDEK